MSLKPSLKRRRDRAAARGGSSPGGGSSRTASGGRLGRRRGTRPRRFTSPGRARPPDVGEDNRMAAPVTHHPVTHRRVTHRPARGSPVAGSTRRWPRAGGRRRDRRDRLGAEGSGQGEIVRGVECSGEGGSSRSAGREEEAVERVQHERRRRGTRATEGGEEARAGVRSSRPRVGVVVAVTKSLSCAHVTRLLFMPATMGCFTPSSRKV